MEDAWRIATLKILQIVDDFPPSIAGDGVHVHQISRELVKRGHNVTVLTTQKNANSPHVQAKRSNLSPAPISGTTISKWQERTNGVRVKRFRPLFQTSYFSFPPQLCTTILREDFDLVHIHRYFSLLSYPAMLLSKLRRKPLVFTPHSATIRERKNLLAMSMKRVFDCTWGRSLIRSPNILIALTPDNVKDYLELRANINKIRVIPNGTNLEKFKSLPDPSKFKEKFGITGEVVLFVGRLVKYKGVQYLLRIAPKILEKVPKTKFIIVGPDFGYKDQLEKLVRALSLQKSVVFTGIISDHELLEAYAAADVFAFPSIHEGFGLVLLDAMACKKPIVTWKTSAMQHVVTDGVSGILVTPWSLADFANSIVLLLTQKKLAADMGEKGRRIVEGKFEWKMVIDALEKVYEEAIANG